MQPRRIRLFRSVGTVLTLALMALLTPTAFAQSSNAAVHWEYTNCSTNPDGYTFCFSRESVYHISVTPSGMK